MKPELRYGDYLRAIGAGRREVSFNAIMPALHRDAQGRPVAPPLGTIRLHPDEIAGLLRPYVSVRFMDQLKAVATLALYLALFQLLILRQLVEKSRAAPLADAPSITAERAERLVDEVRTARRAR